jgi:hypothetical protein
MIIDNPVHAKSPTCKVMRCSLQRQQAGQHKVIVWALGCSALLAERLLAKTDYECDREIRTLELLKLRFGEASLHNCEVAASFLFARPACWSMHWCIKELFSAGICD